MQRKKQEINAKQSERRLDQEFERRLKSIDLEEVEDEEELNKG